MDIRKLRNLLTLGVFLCFFSANGQITGKVVDEEGNPALATIFIDGSNRSVLCDENGQYKLVVEPGTYTLVTYLIGYKSVSKEVEYDGNLLTVDFKIKLLETELDEVVVTSSRADELGISWLESVSGTSIFEAKKTEVIKIEELTGNLATNSSRQVYARVPGLNIFENDAGGLQLAIGGRGLDPNRTSNFNVRQNGYDISADALGYPESYYTPPVQALRQIEIVRGAAGLQYGSQFGGLLNFKFKNGATNKKISLDMSQTVGSFGLFNSFNSVGGTVGKANYYGFVQYKRADDWRPNSSFDQVTGYGKVKYAFNPFHSISFEFTGMNYTAQQPGGLTDAQFEQDPSISTRSRNWFNVGWNLGAIQWDYRVNSRLKFNSRTFFLSANRFALGNLTRIDRPDDIMENRNLIKDTYDNWGTELRMVTNYKLGGSTHILLVGGRYYEGFTQSAQGQGTNASDDDFNFINPEMPDESDFDFPSRNISLFAENIFNISPKFSVTPGFRYEFIRTRAEGYYLNIVRDLAGNLLLSEVIEEERNSPRSVYLFGLGLSYRVNQNNELYANFSQNYRGINFTDIRVNIPSLIVDPNISDESGFNMDLGIRGGKDSNFIYDASVFFLAYRDRIGNILAQIENAPRTLRTNIGDASILGLETYVKWDIAKNFKLNNIGLDIFLNNALIYSQYTSADPRASTLGDLVEGNEVELVPPLNTKIGLNFEFKKFRSSILYSYVSRHFTDAANTDPPAFSAVQGPIPSYDVLDLSFSYRWKSLQFDTGINNLLDKSYFTRRATGYPGPGIIPAQPRSYYFTMRLRI
ncbi:MAG: TonB-dependent receptor [Bacteroidota bacterium]